jgi:23S rRNA (cytosine1962-C5)-methyltransferase
VDDADDYALLDIGDERRLERFGRWRVDRPAPAEGGFARRDPAAWDEVDARYAGSAGGPSEGVDSATDAEAGGWWTGEPAARQPWTANVGGSIFELRLAPSGQVGCFPEQVSNWAWIADRLPRPALTSVGSAPTGPPASPAAAAAAPEILNLFAHTGGSTLAAIRAGARVVHLDAGRSAVAWARRNAELNGWAPAPVRWIVDDALAFTRREARRGRHYAGLILDPPSFGHGPGGRPWRLEDDLPELLAACAAVLDRRARFVVLSAHTAGFDGERLTALLGDALGRRRGGGYQASTLGIDARSGRRLELGAVTRWEA